MTDTRQGLAAVVGRRPVVAGALGALAITSSALLVRFSETAPATAAFWRCAYALPPLVALAAAERRSYGPLGRPATRLAAAAGAFLGLDLVLYHHTIAAVGAGLATVLGNLQVLVVGFLAWAVLGERPERRLLVAVPIVLAGIVLVSGVLGSGAFGADPGLGVILGVATSFFYAAFILLLRSGNRDQRRPAGPLAVATAAGAASALVAGSLSGGVELVPWWPGHGWLVLLALSAQVIAWLLLSVSLPRLPAAVPSLLLLLQPAGALWLGAVLLDESPSAVQMAGVAVVLAGVVFATTGPRRAPA